MPIITEQELQGYTENETENERLRIDLENIKYSYENTIKQRNIFLAIAILLVLILGIIFLLKSIKPELFINGYKLESRGLTIVDTSEYLHLKEIEEQNLINSQNQLTTDNEEEYVEKESIGDQIIYAVQIGAFKNNDIGLYSDSFMQFREFKEAGFHKYSLGAFESLEEAQDFRKKVIGLGFKDSFVASYQNGERINIEEAE